MAYTFHTNGHWVCCRRFAEHAYPTIIVSSCYTFHSYTIRVIDTGLTKYANTICYVSPCSASYPNCIVSSLTCIPIDSDSTIGCSACCDAK